jgi:hypothetical protein
MKKLNEDTLADLVLDLHDYLTTNSSSLDYMDLYNKVERLLEPYHVVTY